MNPYLRNIFCVLLISLGACVPMETTMKNHETEQSQNNGGLQLTQEESTAMEGDMIKFQLSSPAFENKGKIPSKFTCKGEDVSPPLEWKDAPTGVVSYALIMDDPDAPVGTWIHWVIFNIPGLATSLGEGIEPGQDVLDGAIQGKSSWGRNQYNGPCPPAGEHRYFFKLYALDIELNLKGNASKADVIQAIQGHTLGMAELMGVFSR